MPFGFPSTAPLPLRRKFLIGFGLYMLILGLVGALSFFNLLQMDFRVRALANAGQINDTILEARRFEKNYLLYGQERDLREAHDYLTQAREALAALLASAGQDRMDAPLLALEHSIDRYQQAVTRSLEQPGGAAALTLEQQTELRHAGKDMVDQAEHLLEGEHHRIAAILRALRVQLLAAVAVAVASGLVVGYVLFGRLIKALEKVLVATEQIAAGRFQHQSDTEAAPETRQIALAFNHMVAELERRQEQLVQSRKLSSVGTLAAGIAHQLNNPLNNIATSGQIGLEELNDMAPQLATGADCPQTAMLRKMLGNVESEAMRAREIVKGLLEFARKKPFSPVPTRLDEVVAKTLRLVSSQLPHGIEVHSAIPGELAVVVDSQRFQEALLNLVINAGQAIGQGPGQIAISARAADVSDAADADEPGRVLLRIQDTGRGIARENLGRIFDPFFTTKDDGTGLGLSIVYGIIERHGGSIAVESTPGQGTTFTLSLPAPQPAPRPEEQAA